MRLVILESPWRGGGALERLYLRWCLRDSLHRGEAPFASHELYTRALDDADAEERELGMNAGFAWHRSASLQVAYVDLGWSKGMEIGRAYGAGVGLPIEERHLSPALVSSIKKAAQALEDLANWKGPTS